MFRLGLGLVLSLAVVVGFFGCGAAEEADRPARVPATASFTYRGNAVEGANVTFSPAGEKGHAAYGLTDEDGKATLSTFGGDDGAVPGSYKVLVMKTEAEGAAAADEQSEEEEEEEEEVVHKHLLPEKYSRVDMTDLTADVTEDGDNNFTFELKD